MGVPSVAWISYTVVKGLGLQAPSEVELTERGVPDDRRFYLINERGHLTNGKRIGVLQQLQARWAAEPRVLTLELPDGRSVEEEVTTDGQVTTSFYGRAVKGRLVSGPISAAISEFADAELRLVEAPDGASIDRGRKGAVSLLSTASLERLAGAADVDGIDGRRFRMLFGIDGLEAHEE